MASEPKVCGCGALLTPADAKYYGHSCDACERAANDRIEAWRHGADDPELDRAFNEPRTLQ